MYTRVTAEYARKLAAGEIPQQTIPRTPTCDAAYKIHCDAIKSAGMTVGEYLRGSVFSCGTARVLEPSPFPYICDIGISHFIYWMRDGYDPVEDVHDGLSAVFGADVYVVRNTAQSVPEVPHYQIFVHDSSQSITAPCYEFPGVSYDHAAEWETLLGHPVDIKYVDGDNQWQPSPSIAAVGGSTRTFHVSRREEI